MVSCVLPYHAMHKQGTSASSNDTDTVQTPMSAFSRLG